jgi:hypothetical protein
MNAYDQVCQACLIYNTGQLTRQTGNRNHKKNYLIWFLMVVKMSITVIQAVMKTEVVRYSKMLVITNKTKQHNNPEDQILHNNFCKKSTQIQ